MVLIPFNKNANTLDELYQLANNTVFEVNNLNDDVSNLYLMVDVIEDGLSNAVNDIANVVDRLSNVDLTFFNNRQQFFTSNLTVNNFLWVVNTAVVGNLNANFLQGLTTANLVSNNYYNISFPTKTLAVLADITVTGSDLATGGGPINSNVVIDVPRANTNHAEAGTSTTLVMTPATTLSEINTFRPFATETQATELTSNTTIMTPALLKRAIGNSIWQYVWANGSQIVSGTNTVQNDNRIQFAVTANNLYAFEYYVQFSLDAFGGRVSWGMSANANFFFIDMLLIGDTGATVSGPTAGCQTQNDLRVYDIGTANNTGMIMKGGGIVRPQVDAAMILRWSPRILNGASNMTRFRGSYVRFRNITDVAG